MEGDHRWVKVLPPVLVCAALWGSAFPAIKTVYGQWERDGVATGLEALWWFAGVRFTLAGAMLLAIARRPLEQLRASPKAGLIRLGLFQTVAQYVFFYWGMALASGSLAGLTVATGSFWWMLLAPLLAGAAWPRPKQWLAVGIGAAGLVVATQAPVSGGGESWKGVILLVISTGCGALGLIQVGPLSAHMGARAATGYSLLGGGLVLLALGGRSFPRAAELLSLPVIGLTLWLAFVSAAAFSLWNHLSTRHPVPLLAGYRFLIPLAGMFESLLFLPGEKASSGLFIGAALVVAGLVFGQRSR